MPTDVTPEEVVATETITSGKRRGQIKTITAAQKLKEAGARCRKGKLVDSRGREIRFYRLIGCWGNPPEDYQEQLQRQAKELAALRKRYHVVEITCNPAGEQISLLGPYR